MIQFIFGIIFELEFVKQASDSLCFSAQVLFVILYNCLAKEYRWAKVSPNIRNYMKYLIASFYMRQLLIFLIY